MSYDIIKEEVPRFVKRVGDRVIEGSNNTLMVFGTDRAAPGPAKLDSGLGHINADGKGVGTGTWHLITGRAGENPNFVEDKSFIYVSSKTDADKNLESKEEFESNSIPAIIMKTNSMRLVARDNIKMISGPTYMTFDGKEAVTVGVPGPGTGKIYLGSQATEPLIFGKMFQKTFNALVDKVNTLTAAFNAHMHLGNSGSPTSKPMGVPGGAGGSAIPNPTHAAKLVGPPPIPKGPLNPEMIFVPGGSLNENHPHMPDSDLSKISKTK